MLTNVQMSKKYAALHFFKNVITKMGFLISNISAVITSLHIISLKIHYPSSGKDGKYVHFSLAVIYSAQFISFILVLKFIRLLRKPKLIMSIFILKNNTECVARSHIMLWSSLFFSDNKSLSL